MAKICLSLTGKTLARDLEILDRNRKYVDLAELRVDCLDSDERLLLRRFPEMAGLPVILTIRRNIDGGFFSSGEGSRISLLAKGLAYADVDRRRNFAYVDLEEDLDVPSLEEAARTFGTRIIRSRYSFNGLDDNLAEKLRNLNRVGDELVKAALIPRSLEDVIKIYRAAKETKDLEKILFCSGDYSANMTILAEHLGSRISYTSVSEEPDIPLAAPGMLSPGDLAELYRFRDITEETKIFAVSGFPLKVSDLPRYFNALFTAEQSNAVFIPVPADKVGSLMVLANETGISGISITIPHKMDILPHLSRKSGEVVSIGACNTVVAGDQGWVGYNTDAAGFSESLLNFIGKKNFRGRKLTIIGAGGVARAVAAEVYRLKGKALIINRTMIRARALAERYRFAWAGLDSRGLELLEKYSDIIIQTTSAGMYPDVDTDPIEFYKFTGKEIVMDLIYKPEKTRCLLRAEEAGCPILNGYDMLLRQARLQYTHYMNREFPPSLLSRVGFK